MGAVDNPRWFIIAGAFGIAIGVAQLFLGPHVPLAVLFIATGFLVMLIPFSRRVIDFFGLAWIALGVALLLDGGEVVGAVIAFALGVGWIVVIAILNRRRRRVIEPPERI